MFGYTGLLLTLLSWGMGLYIVIKWRDKNLTTISKHAASSKKASILFAVTLIGCGLIFYFWQLTWLIPRLHLGSLFIAVVTLAVFFQVLTGAIPDTSGRARFLHRLFAYSMAVLFIPLALILATSSYLSPLQAFLSECIAIYMIITFLLFIFFAKQLRNYHLPFQTLYILTFQLLILIVAYL